MNEIIIKNNFILMRLITISLNDIKYFVPKPLDNI